LGIAEKFTLIELREHHVPRTIRLRHVIDHPIGDVATKGLVGKRG
jgi:hypothetical protein